MKIRFFSLLAIFVLIMIGSATLVINNIDLAISLQSQMRQLQRNEQLATCGRLATTPGS